MLTREIFQHSRINKLQRFHEDVQFLLFIRVAQHYLRVTDLTLRTKADAKGD